MQSERWGGRARWRASRRLGHRVRAAQQKRGSTSLREARRGTIARCQTRQGNTATTFHLVAVLERFATLARLEMLSPFPSAIAGVGTVYGRVSTTLRRQLRQWQRSVTSLSEPRRGTRPSYSVIQAQRSQSCAFGPNGVQLRARRWRRGDRTPTREHEDGRWTRPERPPALRLLNLFHVSFRPDNDVPIVLLDGDGATTRRSFFDAFKRLSISVLLVAVSNTNLFFHCPLRNDESLTSILFFKVYTAAVGASRTSHAGGWGTASPAAKRRGKGRRSLGERPSLGVVDRPGPAFAGRASWCGQPRLVQDLHRPTTASLRSAPLPKGRRSERRVARETPSVAEAVPRAQI